jgi:hypothetical protein
MAKKRSMPKMSPEVKEAYKQVQSGVRSIGKSIDEIRQGLRKAERQIEADARARIKTLRQEARTQVAALQSRRQDAARTLGRLAGAAGGSWQDVKESADATLSEARSLASSVVERFRNALRA